MPPTVQQLTTSFIACDHHLLAECCIVQGMRCFCSVVLRSQYVWCVRSPSPTHRHVRLPERSQRRCCGFCLCCCCGQLGGSCCRVTGEPLSSPLDQRPECGAGAHAERSVLALPHSRHLPAEHALAVDVWTASCCLSQKDSAPVRSVQHCRPKAGRGAQGGGVRTISKWRMHARVAKASMSEMQLGRGRDGDVKAEDCSSSYISQREFSRSLGRLQVQWHVARSS